MAHVLKPPAPLLLAANQRTLFLAGSIAQGAAADWQAQVTHYLADLPIMILNPRRDAWDASWQQSISNPMFREQVEWELAAQEQADLIAMYFDPATQAPITLLELGLFAHTGRLLVACPEGFWRKGNVEIVCTRYAIPLLPDLASLMSQVRSSMQHLIGVPDSC